MHNLTELEIETIKNIDNEYDKALYLVSILFKYIMDKSGEPYLNHLIRVSINVKNYLTKVAALLHDTVEDIDNITFDDLKEFGFSEYVINLVKLVTKNKDIVTSYHDRITNIIESGNIEAVRLKYADISDNYSEQRLKKLDKETQEKLANKYKCEIIRLREFLEKIEKDGNNDRY